MSASRWSWLRRFTACIASTLVTDLVARKIEWARPALSERIFIGALISVPLLAGVLIWVRSTTAQLIARGIWWGGLLFATLGALSGDAELACQSALLLSAALLATGTSGLEEDAGGFRPVAFRGTLLLALVLSMADTGTLLWYALGDALFGGHRSLLLLTVPMIASVVGLLRLRTWGLLLGLLCNLAVAILAITRVIPMPAPMRALYLGTATLQLIVPLPMLITLVRRRVPAPDGWRHTKRFASTTVILGLAALSTWSAFVHRGGPIVRF